MGGLGTAPGRPIRTWEGSSVLLTDSRNSSKCSQNMVLTGLLGVVGPRVRITGGRRRMEAGAEMEGTRRCL